MGRSSPFWMTMALALLTGCRETPPSVRGAASAAESSTASPSERATTTPATTPRPGAASKPAGASAPVSARSTSASTAAGTRPPTSSPERELTWRWPDSAVGPMEVVVSIPETDHPLPVLIAMHGLGESRKGPRLGARGWLDDYRLDVALGRLTAPPLSSADYQGLGGAKRREAISASLKATPYRGLILVMPYTPDILEPDRSLDGADALGRFLVEDLLPRLRAETPARTEPSATGIDGVSLGGRAALLVGLAHPKVFGVVGSLQAAIYPHEVDALVDRVSSARAANPEQQLRLVTSSGDFYRGTLGRLSKALTAEQLSHRFLVVEGPHSYAFNRGPGVYELLTFHDRALRGEPPIGAGEDG